MSRTNWLTILLVFSIGLNLIFVGVVIGRAVFGMPPGRPHFDWIMQEISDDTRQKLRGSIREHMRTTRPLRKELRTAQRALRAAITADTYEETAVSAGFAEVRRASTALQEAMHTQIIQNLGELNPDERINVFRLMIRRGGEQKEGPPVPRLDRPGSVMDDD